MKYFITKKSFYISILSITIPVAMQNLIGFGIQMMDTLMVGRLGDSQLSAVAQANQPGFIFFFFLFGLAGGGSVLASQYWGKGNIEAVRHVVGIVLRIAIIASLLVSLIAILFTKEIMLIFLKTKTSQDMAIVAEAVSS